MQLNLTLILDNAAFGDSQETRAAEIAHILANLAEDLDGSDVSLMECTGGYTLRDSNGNRVGRAVIVD